MVYVNERSYTLGPKDTYFKVFLKDGIKGWNDFDSHDVWYYGSQYHPSVFTFEMNEWLTENCKDLWGIFSKEWIENKLVETDKPFIAFRNRTDALLFKLTIDL